MKRTFVKIVVFAVLLLLILEPFFPPLASSSNNGVSPDITPSLPSYIIHNVTIVIHNGQNIPTQRPFQQMIIINSSSYSAYESGNLRNVEFLYHNGSVIPSWLESGAYNSSFSTVYWLKLDNGIPANSNLSILLGFASKNTRLMDGITVGEAPGVSHVYGKYDNGANIFRFYDNFSGTSLNGSSWVSNDTIRYVNDGLILNFQSSG